MILGLTQQQWRLIGKALFTAGSPVALLLMKAFDVTPSEWENWVNLASIVVPIVGSAWIAKDGSVHSQVKAAATLPQDAQQRVADSMSDSIKAEAARKVEGVLVTVDPVTAPSSVVDMAMDPDLPYIEVRSAEKGRIV